MFHPVKLGLDIMKQLHDLLGSPMDNADRAVIHVAGKNGKGSVRLKIANSLQQSSGNIVGLFCSPQQVVGWQVNSEMGTEKEVVEMLPEDGLCIKYYDDPATFLRSLLPLPLLFMHNEMPIS
jgi:dihydrofolate synthase/folylpolyglutamate synthase